MYAEDWEVGVHGILISFDVKGNHYSGTFLPEVAAEQGWDQETTVEYLVRKAGYRKELSEDVLSRIQTTRYQSSKYHLSYEDYERNRG